MSSTTEQPNRLVNCCCCGQGGERGEFYHDKFNDRWACVDLEACMQRQDASVWLPLESAPFSTWILLLWRGGLIPHYEIAKGQIVINERFEREKYWDGYEYRPMDRIVGWHPLPAIPVEDLRFLPEEPVAVMSDAPESYGGTD